MSARQRSSRVVGRLQAGFSLIELLVAMVINLVIIIAAIYLYLGTRESQRALDQSAMASEVGVYALRALGRELTNAGFYPAVASEGQVNTIAGYSNITTPAVAAYATGIFGCEGSSFDLAGGACTTTAADAPDGLVISYFTNDAFGATGGQRNDCNGTDVGTAAVNATRVGTGPATQPPAKPLLVANHYRLSDPTEVDINGQTVALRSLECRGNASARYQSIVAGVDDFQVTYALYADDTKTPMQFISATDVTDAGPVTIDSKVIPAWGRVVAVRICVISRTYEPNVKLADGGTARTYKACDGSDATPDASDRSIRKNYTQVFGVRNFLTATY